MDNNNNEKYLRVLFPSAKKAVKGRTRSLSISPFSLFACSGGQRGGELFRKRYAMTYIPALVDLGCDTQQLPFSAVRATIREDDVRWLHCTSMGFYKIHLIVENGMQTLSRSRTCECTVASMKALFLNFICSLLLVLVKNFIYTNLYPNIRVCI